MQRVEGLDRAVLTDGEVDRDRLLAVALATAAAGFLPGAFFAPVLRALDCLVQLGVFAVMAAAGRAAESACSAPRGQTVR